MKKIIAVIAVAVIICAAGIFFAKSNLFSSTNGKSSSEVSSTPSQASSENIPSSSSEGSSSDGNTSDNETVKKIKSAINADWKKYKLKEEKDKKTINGKTYLTYSMWNDDYQEGPLILVDKDTGKVSTWVSSDSSPVPAEKDGAFDKTVHSVTVTITDGAMMSYVGKTNDGYQLTVPRYGVDLVNSSGIQIGDKIKIYYTGIIKGDDMSRAFITKLEKVG